MYTRNYEEPQSVGIPRGYSGTMIDTSIPEEVDAPINEEPIETPVEEVAEPTSGGGILGSQSFGLGALPFLSAIPEKIKGLFWGKGEGFHIGTEELLIIAAAAFLFFSKDGDRECAIMLILLLFIT